ncbi:MAG: response regulator transcription factor [Burkholderiales bacterium]
MRVALLEDDPDQSEVLRIWLEGAGHHVHVYARSKDFLREVARESFDVLLLDWMVPGMSGVEALKWLRANLSERVPAILITLRDAEEDVVAGLAAGADDYLVKPPRKLELLARIEAVMRRTQGAPVTQGPMRCGDLVLDPVTRGATVDSVAVDLTQKEFDVAFFMLKNIGRVLSRGHLLEAVWGQSSELNTRTVDKHISRVRTQLRLVPERGWRLVAVFAHGYRLERIEGTANTADT